MEKVKGCPFCGSRCKLVEEWSDYIMEPGVQHPMKSRLIFGCPSCDCTITVEAEGEKSAVRIWQTREGTERPNEKKEDQMTETEKVAFESGYIAGYNAASKDFKHELKLTCDMIKLSNEQLVKMIRSVAQVNGTADEVEKQLSSLGFSETRRK